MAFWFDDEKQEDLSFAYLGGISSAKTITEKTITEEEEINQDLKKIDNLLLDDLYDYVYLDRIENKLVSEAIQKINKDKYNIIIKNNLLLVYKKDLTFDYLAEIKQEKWIDKKEIKTSWEIKNNILKINHTYEVNSKIKQELIDQLKVGNRVPVNTENVDFDINEHNKIMGKIYNLDILFRYIYRMQELTNFNIVVKELFSLTRDEYDRIYDYSKYKNLVYKCQNNEDDVFNRFISLLETKIEPVLNRLNVDFIPFRSMLLSFKAKVKKGLLK